MDLGLRGRTAIVTGASAGMGLAIAEALSDEGANVAMFARRRDVLEREAERLGALAVRGDLTVAADLERLVELTLEAFHGVDVLVLNGGGPSPGRAVELQPDQLEDALALLFLPFVRLTALCLAHLRASGRGRMILIESTSIKQPIENLVLSNAVRPGIAGWAKTLSRELGPDGITVNTIAPGWIDTERVRVMYGGAPPAEAVADVPLGRLGRPREIADVVCFLSSEQASYVTGAVVSVDGGAGRGIW